MVFSVCPSVHLSVCPSHLFDCSHHRIIVQFSGVITNDERKVHAKGQGQRSKVKVTEVTTQLNRFRTVTAVWIHIWWWNYAYSLMLLRRGALLFFKVIRQILRSDLTWFAILDGLALDPTNYSTCRFLSLNDRFSLVSVRVKLHWLQLERSENQQPIPGHCMRL